MDVRLLIDAIVRQTTVLIAQLATTAGVRAPLAHVANQVFLDLVEAIEAQGVGKKVAADMFGLALRSYQQKVQRLSESATERGVTLWQAVYQHIQTHKSLSRAEIMRRFSHDDESSVRGILHDLVETGLVYRSGRGDATRYRVVEDEELAHAADEQHTQEALSALLWISIYRSSPIDTDALIQALGIEDRPWQAALETLINEGRILRQGQQLRCDHCYIPLGVEAGFEAALFDHYQAVTTAIVNKLKNGATRALPNDALGGSTYSFDLWPGHPHEQEVYNLLTTTRQRLGALWDNVRAHNAQHIPGAPHTKITFYIGQNVQRDDLSQGHHDD